MHSCPFIHLAEGPSQPHPGFSHHPSPPLPPLPPHRPRPPLLHPQATFTFVLRAFSTLEGIGKTLVPTYRFSEVAQPYATVGVVQASLLS